MDVGPVAIERNRELWALVNDRFTDADAEITWTSAGIAWGLFQHREDDLDLLGDVVEIGCGIDAGGEAVAVGVDGTAPDAELTRLSRGAAPRIR